MPTTTNFGWTTPADTDLVKDGASAMRTLAGGIDTSMAQLKGGTTGQILSKTSNTDMAFTWINNDQGDITAVNVSSPITGGGTSGAVTISIQDATTTQKGAVQLENSTSSTSTTTAAVPASVKSAYDLANGAIPKSLVDAKGDLIVATANDTVARLAVGTDGQVLTADAASSGGLKWASASSGAYTTLASGNLNTSTSSLTFSGISSSYKDLYLYLDNWGAGSTWTAYFLINNQGGTNYNNQMTTVSLGYGAVQSNWNNGAGIRLNDFTWQNHNNYAARCLIKIPNYSWTDSTPNLSYTQFVETIACGYTVDTSNFATMRGFGSFQTTGAPPLNSIQLYASGNFTKGTYTLLGVK